MSKVFQFSPAELDSTLKILNDAIKNHRSWFDKLHTSMLCGLPFPDDILNQQAHTCCQFGKWYYGDASEAIKSYKEFHELEQAHKFMHDNARELAIKCQQKLQITKPDYLPFLENQHYLIDLLGSLHDSLLEHQYCFDALTGAINRKSISMFLEQSFESVKRYDHNFSVAMLDVDHFKNINDEYGHLTGDVVLKQLAVFLRNELRKSDCVGRYGGEEFIILMPETDKQSACKVMEKCRKDLASHSIKCADIEINITASIGVEQLSSNDDDCWEGVKRADRALYKAKENGRNRTELSGTL